MLKIATLLAGAGLVCFSALSVASDSPYPNKPIEIYVGFGPGAGVDSVARLYGKKLQEELNTPVIVVNKPGAYQLLAVRPTLTADPDGHTFFMGVGSSLTMGPAIRKDLLPYNPVTDMSPIAMIGVTQGVLIASPSSKFDSFDGLIQYAKENPNGVNYGSSGMGAANHVITEYISNAMGMKMTHIPFKSDVELLAAVAAGSVDVAFTTAQAGIPFAKDGRVKALAVTGNKKIAGLENAVILGQHPDKAISNIGNYSFAALVGPKNIPQEKVQKVNAAINKISGMPDVIDNVVNAVYYEEPYIWNSSQLGDFIEQEYNKWSDAGSRIKLE